MEATRSLDDSNFGPISHRIGVFAADGLSFTHTGHTLEPAMQLLIDSRHRFCHGFVPISPSKPSNFYAPLDSPVNTTFSPHPLGSLELAVGPYHHHGHQWLQRTMPSTWHALDGHFYGQGAQQPLTPGQ